MRRFVIAVFAFALLCSSATLLAQKNEAVEKDLQAKEQSGWQAWKDHDSKAFSDLLPDNAVNIADGAFDKGKSQIMKSMSSGDCKVNSFSLSDFSYLWLDKDTVVMSYNANQDATCGGKKLADKVIASSVWQKKGGKWVSPFHQETAAGGM